VLSHRSAATTWRLLDPRRGDIEVTVVGRDCGPREGIRHRRTKELDSRDVRRRDGLLVTAPARTLLDVASLIDDRDLERALNEAFVLRLTTVRELHAAMLRSRGRPGAPKLRALLDSIEGRGITRSEAERRLGRLLARSGLSAPETNTMVGPYEVDMLWRSAGLVVEVDGWAFHSTRAAFERDRARDADLQARGLRVLRFTWRQIVDQPDVVVARVTQLLKR
jgi:very-short-patch-repair endonuclease